MVNVIGPVAAFDVLVCPIGSRDSPSISHCNPDDVPDMGASGNSDTTSPATVSNRIAGGHKNTTSLAPNNTQARSGWDSSTLSDAS